MNVDHIFHLEYLQHIKAYKNIGKKSYIYFNTPNSISKKIFSFEEYLAIIELIIPRTKKVIERFNIINKQLYYLPIKSKLISNQDDFNQLVLSYVVTQIWDVTVCLL